MLGLASTTKNDVVYDLGCGDGRIPITAARKYGARGVGIDIDPKRIEESKANAKAAGVEHLVEFRLQDALQADVSRCDRGDVVHAGIGQRATAPRADPSAQAGRADRVARLQHGASLAAAKNRSIRQRAWRRGDSVPLDGGRKDQTVTSAAPAPTAQRQWPRLWVWVFGLILGWSLATWLTGGFFLEWPGLRVSSRNPTRPLGVALLVLAWAFWRYGRDGLERDLDVFRIDIDLTRWAAPLALLVSLMTLGVGLTWATRVAGGSDSWGYVSQAKLWAEGNLIVEQPIATQVEWPNASHSFAPLGYMPKGEAGAIVPTYPPGYPMLMALLSLVHPDAVFWVVPLSGALLVWMSYRLGQALDTPATGLLTSALVATSPAFLFQLVIPMSDVVVASLWVTALVVAMPNRFETWLGAGTISSLAILTRPNTAPIAAIFFIGAFWNWRDWRDPTGARRRLLKVLAYGTGIVPGLLSAAAIQTALYRRAVQIRVWHGGQSLRVVELSSESGQLPSVVAGVGNADRLPRRGRAILHQGCPQTMAPDGDRTVCRRDLAVLRLLPGLRPVVVFAVPFDGVSLHPRADGRVVHRPAASRATRDTDPARGRHPRGRYRLASGLRKGRRNLHGVEARTPLRGRWTPHQRIAGATRDLVQRPAQRQPALLRTTAHASLGSARRLVV